MGYLLFESSEAGFQTALAQVHDAISETGTRDDGSVELQITINGKTSKTIVCNVHQPEELLEILRLNVE